jgi:hypothetical protein
MLAMRTPRTDEALLHPEVTWCTFRPSSPRRAGPLFDLSLHTGTVKASTILKTYAYKPYGGILQQSGVGPDPKFLWNACVGYRITSRAYSDLYVRRRHLSSILALWTTLDDYWPSVRAYSYSSSNPVSISDASGQLQWVPNCCTVPRLFDLQSMSGIHCSQGTLMLAASVDCKMTWTIAFDTLHCSYPSLQSFVSWSEKSNHPTTPPPGVPPDPADVWVTFPSERVSPWTQDYHQQQSVVEMQTHCNGGGVGTITDPTVVNYVNIMPDNVHCLCWRLVAVSTCPEDYGPSKEWKASKTVIFTVSTDSLGRRGAHGAQVILDDPDTNAYCESSGAIKCKQDRGGLR